MSHKSSWRGLIAAAALILTTPPAFSQETKFIEMTKAAGREDNLIVFDSALNAPAPGFFMHVGEFGAMPGCPIPPGGRPPFFHMPPPPFANLDLTDDQVRRLAKLKRTFESGESQAFAALRSLEDEMRDELSQDNINESDVRKLAEAVAQQKAEMSKRFSAHILESARVLTPEQRQQIRLAQDRMELGPLGGFGKPPNPPLPPRPPQPGK